jgi:hypothetical protein
MTYPESHKQFQIMGIEQIESSLLFLNQVTEFLYILTRLNVPASVTMAPWVDGVTQSSLPGLWKFPTYRKELIKYALLWMEGKKVDDNTCGLWRIHDGLYDFSEWIYKHPGGSDWLEITKVHPVGFCTLHNGSHLDGK